MGVLGNYITTPNLYDVPPAYQKVEYLRAPGAASLTAYGQYIDLPCTTDQVAKGSIKWVNNWVSGWANQGYYATLFGGTTKPDPASSGDYDSALVFSIARSSTSYEGIIYGANARVSLGAYATGTPFTLDFEVSSGSQKYIINGTTTTTSAYAQGVLSPAPMRLFVAYYSDYSTLSGYNALFFSVSDIYYFKLWDANDRKIIDCIPCYRKSDNKPGMFDLVSRQFLTNSGTGEFTVGPNV